MRVAHLSTWACRCGLAEYVQILASGIVAQQKAFVNVPTPKSGLSLGYVSVARHVPTVPFFKPVYLEGEWWGSDAEDLMAFEPEILHVQFQTNLYQQHWLANLLYTVRQGRGSWKGAKVVFTLHDSGMWQGWDWSQVDLAIAHREETIAHVPAAVARAVLPQPIPLTPIQLCTFGLGRTPESEVRAALEPYGIEFCVKGYSKSDWDPLAYLLLWIKKFDGVVLWYPRTEASVSSSALRMALAARRPVLCSNTSWFREARGKFVHKFETLEEMAIGIQNHFADEFISEGEVRRVAERHSQLYRQFLGL